MALLAWVCMVGSAAQRLCKRLLGSRGALTAAARSSTAGNRAALANARSAAYAPEPARARARSSNHCGGAQLLPRKLRQQALRLVHIALEVAVSAGQL